MLHKLKNKPEEMKEYILAFEIRVVVVSFQCVPTGMSPYFSICAKPQRINKRTKYGESVIDAFLKLQPMLIILHS